jgi:hypothetical protein
VPETPKISQNVRISNNLFFNPKVQEKVAELNKELTLQLYGEPLKDDDGDIMPWKF